MISGMKKRKAWQKAEYRKRIKHVVMTQWYTYLLAVHTPPGKKGDGFSAFAQSKHLLYCRFDPDGFIYLHTSKDHAMGQYRFVSCREVEEAFPEALWQTKDPCPYVEHVQGYVNWEF